MKLRCTSGKHRPSRFRSASLSQSGVNREHEPFCSNRHEGNTGPSASIRLHYRNVGVNRESSPAAPIGAKETRALLLIPQKINKGTRALGINGITSPRNTKETRALQHQWEHRPKQYKGNTGPSASMETRAHFGTKETRALRLRR